MTPRQKDMLDAIRDLTVDGVSPTYEQLRVHLGIASKSGVNRMIVGLEAQGHVRRLKGCRRTVAVIERSGGGISDDRIALMSEAALESALVRISAALSIRRATASRKAA